jgi:CubicO group peptidase (beta-lactamase class C family)
VLQHTGYILLGLVVEAVTGNPLAQELDRCILGPLGLAGTSLRPAPPAPSPASRGYSLRRGPGGHALDGPLLASPSRTPRTPGRRVGWCPTSRI